MKKSWLSIPLASMLLLSACGGADSDGTSDEGKVDVSAEDNMDDTVSLTAFGIKAPAATRDWDEMEFMDELAENVNVDMEWTNATPQTAGEQVNLMFASNDLPDILYSAWTLGGTDLVKYGANGQLLPLNDLIDEHAPNIKAFLEARPNVLGQISAPDGNIYAIPQYDEAPWSRSNDAMFINTEWLDQVGMDMPTTTDEFKEVLIAFRDADLNGNGDASDEIPFSFTLTNAIRGAHSLSGSFGVLGRFLGVEDSQVFFAPTRDEYKDYLNWMHELYAEGLIDPEAFTHDVQVYDSKIKSSTPILGSYFSWSLTSDYGTTDHAYQVLPPLEGPNGDKGWNVQGFTMSQSGFSITGENPNPVRSIKWVDQMYDPDMSFQINAGPLGTNIEKDDDGFYTYIDTPEGMGYEEFRHLETPGSYGAFAILEEMYENIERSEGNQEKLEYAEMYGEYQPEEYFPVVMYSEEDGDRITVLQSDIQDFAYQQIAEFIINGTADAEWDAYLAQLEQLGLEEYLEIQQKYYDSFLEQQ